MTDTRAEQRGRLQERRRIVAFLRSPIETAGGSPPSLEPHQVCDFLELVLGGLADAIEQDLHPKLTEQTGAEH